mmetsp:Transcript_6830/g.9380  ORF Transcript_6830/g.9380 Transcript_6830/m.9380 type:complete len:2486 (+) Transcript_6830:6143-13600(+)
MSRYFNRFDHTSAKKYNAFVDQTDAAITYAVGELGSEGVLSLISGIGNNLFTKAYSISENTIKFHRATETNNGEFVIFGSKENEGVLEAILVRVRDTGVVLWSASYNQGGIDRCVDMVKAGEDDFFFLVEMRPEMNTFEIVKVDGSDGSVLADFQAVPEEFNYFPQGLEVDGTSILTYGSTDMNSVRESYFIDLNSSLVAQSSETVSNGRYQVPKDVLFKESGKFVVVGDFEETRESMIYEYRSGMGSGSVSAEIMDICENVNDEGIKRIKKWNDSPEEYLLLAQNDPRSDAYLCEFNSSYDIQSRYKISQLADFQLNDLQVFPSDSEAIRAVGGYNAAMDEGLVLRTNDQFELCCITNISTPVDYTKTFTVSTFTLEDTSPRRSETLITLVVADASLTKEEECPSSEIDLTGTPMFQSPYLYMQAAGSDASDDTVKGFHLRWHLKGIVGNRHFPKGHLSGPFGMYSATYGFNKSEDFGILHRTPFVDNYYTSLDLTAQPNTYNVGGTIREWRYTNLNPVGVTSPTSADVIVSFPDTSAYDIQAASTPPTSSTDNFLKNYSGEINIRMEGKLSFRVRWDFGYVNSGDLSDALFRHELVSLENSEDTSTQFVKKRNTLDSNDFPGSKTTICEDVYMVRYDRVNAYPTALRFYAYADYIQGVNQNSAWTKISENALTINQTEAFTRLEDAPAIEINNKWPKFNDDNSTTGRFKVNVANYEDRWARPNGIKAGVQKYLSLSTISTNYLAEEDVPVTPKGTLNNSHEQSISYFGMLGLAGIDYHVARMLGFGEIDPMPNAGESDEYIYLVEYNTEGDLEDGLGARDVKHLYMTPEQTIVDFKSPPVPELQDPITYGLAFNNGSATPNQTTDANGYTPFADIRFVNLNRQPFAYEQPFGNFFQQTDNFDRTFAADPVGYGLEYKDEGSAFVAPELNHDRFYKDNDDVFETNLIPNTGNNPVYRHQERTEGVHCYRMYGVNWFSRTSGLSPEVCTDETIFPVRNTIAPPANLAAHLIQPETPPVLTTSDEQTAYEALSGDKTYVRAVFDWNYIQNLQYQFADRAEFFFNSVEKITTKGEITAINSMSNNRLELVTGSYNITSGVSIETVTPTIPQISEDNFKGSLIAIDGLNYRVESIVNTGGGTGENPKIIIHKIRETNSVQTTTGSNSWTTTESFIGPNVGDRFLVSENLTVASHWENELEKTLYLETFSTNDTLEVTGSTNNNGNYTIDSVAYNAPNTVIAVKEDVNDTINDGSIEVQLRFPSKGFTSGNGYLIDGDVTSYFALVNNSKVNVKGSTFNDNELDLGTVTFNGTDTEVPVVQTLNATSSVAYLYITVSISVADYDATAKTVAVAGDYSGLIIPTYKELRQNEDGTTTLMHVGGMVLSGTIQEVADVYSDIDIANGHGGGAVAGDPIPNSRTGAYKITFTGDPRLKHIDPEVSWFNGKIRIMEDASFLPTTLDPRTTTRMKELNVGRVYIDDQTQDLVIVASDDTFEITRDLGGTGPFDPQGEYVPIVTGAQQVNYHPSYSLYLTEDTPNTFNESSTLPQLVNSGSRRTFLGMRVVDAEKNDPVADNLASRMSVPAALNAMEIREPEQPDAPIGELFATRPDFYGKSTYTMDIGFSNHTEDPYSILVFKSNGRKILETLYKPATVQAIVDNFGGDIKNDPSFQTRWEEFVIVDVDIAPPTGVYEFKEHDGYRFPIPDNDQYIVPETETWITPVKPFENNTTPPGSPNIVYDQVSMKTIVEEAIEGAFVSITKEPMVFEHINEAATPHAQTSADAPVLRDENGQRLGVNDNAYNPYPNAIRLVNGQLRFTDNNIDGASEDFYFYYALEMTDQLKKGDPSLKIGPIQTINTRAAKKPNIKKVLTVLEDAALGTQTSICFKIEDYVKSEHISRVDIYRATNALDALSVRTMDKAAEVDVSSGIATADICDTFDNLAYPLYGEDLHYRLVALREVTLEDGQSTEFIPSEASEIARAVIVDPVNPAAPNLTSINGATTATEMQNVVLTWDITCYNGEYILDKLSPDGSWTEIYRVSSKLDAMQYPPLVGGNPDFTNFNQTASLAREDEFGDPIYHTFRVRVTNSGGRLNIGEAPLTLDQGCSDLLQLGTFVSYSDDNTFTQSEISSQQIEAGFNNPGGKMIITGLINTNPPAGHNSFTEIVVSVDDGQGNIYTQSSNNVLDTFTFNDGDGDDPGMSLELNTAHLTYTVTTILKTDYCTNGLKRMYQMEYIWPMSQLLQVTDILSMTDGNSQTVPVFEGGEINNGFMAPQSLTFTDITDLAPLGLTFDKIELALNDTTGYTKSLEISSATGNVVFNDGDFDEVDEEITLVKDNEFYTLKVKLYVNELSTPLEFLYNFQYTYTPYQDLDVIASPVSYTDASGNSSNPLDHLTVTSGNAYPGTITFTDIIGGSLPVGHSFEKTEVLLVDSNGSSFEKEIASSGGIAQFLNGDGGLNLSGSNLSYTVYARLYTDLCPEGKLFTFYIKFDV